MVLYIINRLSLFTFIIFYITAGFAQQPTQEWVRRYSGPMSNGSSGLSVKLDNAGNVYVLTEISTPATLDDFGVIKYSPAGSLLWEGVYNSPGNLSDQAAAFEVTGAGDVYITGSSGINFEYHILTVKFNSAGILQWAEVYDGEGPGDSPGSIILDNGENILVVGSSANVSSASALIIKYNSSGDSVWVRKFTELSPASRNENGVIDDLNNIYNVGYVGSDYLITKYNSSGQLQWYFAYNSPQTYSDQAHHIDIDINGNVYVVGTNLVPTSSFNNTLIKLNNIGGLQWERIFTGVLPGNGRCQRPKGIAVTPDGSSIYYTTFCANGTGGGGYDIVTLSYNSDGDSNWVRRYWGGVGATANEPYSLKLDKFGNIYVTGRASYVVSGQDYTTIRYLPDGIQNWVVTYNGPLTNGNDYAYSSYIDTNLNIYITGISRNASGNGWEAATIKYSQTLGISNYSNKNPTNFALLQNYPNPFNSSTVIIYQLSHRGIVELVLYNLLGQKIKVIKDATEGRGTYSLLLNFDNFTSGIYFLKMTVNGVYINSKKLILLK
jgi:hypothetical protein